MKLTPGQLEAIKELYGRIHPCDQLLAYIALLEQEIDTARSRVRSAEALASARKVNR